jgi:nitronate monooxygenase
MGIFITKLVNAARTEKSTNLETVNFARLVDLKVHHNTNIYDRTNGGQMFSDPAGPIMIDPNNMNSPFPQLKKELRIPVLSAGGIGTGKGIKEMLLLGSDGVSMGSIFIATKEAPVSEEYKKACVQYGAKDIVLTTKLSGTPCTVINTPYVQKVGTSQNWFEKILNKNKKLKKWFKALTFLRGMKSLRNAAFSSTYKTVWCAGPSIEHVHEIRTVQEVVEELKKDFQNS